MTSGLPRIHFTRGNCRETVGGLWVWGSGESCSDRPSSGACCSLLWPPRRTKAVQVQPRKCQKGIERAVSSEPPDSAHGTPLPSHGVTAPSGDKQLSLRGLGTAVRGRNAGRCLRPAAVGESLSPGTPACPTTPAASAHCAPSPRGLGFDLHSRMTCVAKTNQPTQPSARYS